VFYFQTMFQQALNSIDSFSITSGVVGIAETILLLSFLYSAYQAFAMGGDVRALAVSGAKYLALGLVFVSYGTVFRDVNSAFNSVAMSISNSVGAGDLFSNWMTQLGQYWNNNGNQSLWSLIGGFAASLSGFLDALLIIVAYLIFPIAYALFALFYSLYGSILYVTGPLVLALLPAYGMGQLARTYLVNLLIFHAWGLVYAIIGALTVAINMNSVQAVLNSGGVAGFFQNASADLLLALASILFSVAIAFIPYLASRIVRGDIGSTVIMVVKSLPSPEKWG
jgi:hypothetical protein